jgi:hypothetical protein
MKKRVFIFTLLIAFLCLGIFSSANASVVKWQQMPLMDQWGFDYSSETQVPSAVADDWQCNDNRDVIAIRWWGSYWNAGKYYPYPNSDHLGDPANVPPNTVTGFIISIYDDVPAGDGFPYWSHPGKTLYEATLSMGQVTENEFGKIDHADGKIGIGTDIIETVFQYKANLPIPFQQEIGTVYWLSIVAIDRDGNPIQWGWHQAEDFWRDNAVQAGYYKPIYWNLLPDKDMAFELEVVPLPNTLLLVASGLIGILGFKRKLGGD